VSWRPHPKRARVNPRNPEAWGTDDRSGFVQNLVDLAWEYRWAGTQLINTRILTGDAYRDVPNEQERTIKIPPDPDPVLNARPETYQVDEFMNTPLYAESGQVLRNEPDNKPLLNDTPSEGD
jgi:hypothetical protein